MGWIMGKDSPIRAYHDKIPCKSGKPRTRYAEERFAFAYFAFSWQTEWRSRVTRSKKEWIICDIPQPSTGLRRLLAVDLLLYDYGATTITITAFD